MAALEAMACGVPVVSTDVGSLQEIVVEGESGRLVPARDDGALAAALMELVESPETRRRMGHASRERAVRHFSVETTMRHYLRAFDLALAGGRGATPAE